MRQPVSRWRGGEVSGSFDHLTPEEPLEIRINGEPVSVTMRSPGHDLELVTGMLVTEGMLAAGVRPLLRHEHPNIVNAAIERSDSLLDRVRRATVTSASCGLCGKSTIEAVNQHYPPVEDDVRLSAAALQTMVDRMQSAQGSFERTGGSHAAALFGPDGALAVVREDVGRHNATDKVIGHAALRKLLPLRSYTLLVSGRLSFEIVQKALAARIPVVAAVSAPSSLAVELAAAANQTLVGFLRAGRCNVYTHPERIVA